MIRRAAATLALALAAFGCEADEFVVFESNAVPDAGEADAGENDGGTFDGGYPPRDGGVVCAQRVYDIEHSPLGTVTDDDALEIDTGWEEFAVLSKAPDGTITVGRFPITGEVRRSHVAQSLDGHTPLALRSVVVQASSEPNCNIDVDDYVVTAVDPAGRAVAAEFGLINEVNHVRTVTTTEDWTVRDALVQRRGVFLVKQRGDGPLTVEVERYGGLFSNPPLRLNGEATSVGAVRAVGVPGGVWVGYVVGTGASGSVLAEEVGDVAGVPTGQAGGVNGQCEVLDLDLALLDEEHVLIAYGCVDGAWVATVNLPRPWLIMQSPLALGRGGSRPRVLARDNRAFVAFWKTEATTPRLEVFELLRETLVDIDVPSTPIANEPGPHAMGIIKLQENIYRVAVVTTDFEAGASSGEAELTRFTLCIPE